MWRYVFRRLLVVIPTILLILVFAFYLQSLSSEDDIDRMLNLEGVGKNSSFSSYLDSYRTLAHQAGSDRAQFYFSVSPDYIPQGINEIVPLTTRKDAIKISRQTQSPDHVREIFLTIDKLIQYSENENLDELTSMLLQLRSSKSLSALQSRYPLIPKIILANDKIEKEVDLLGMQIEGLSESTDWVFPVFRWHGINNRFHKLIQSGIFACRSLIDGAQVSHKIIDALRWTITLSILNLIFIGVFTILISYLQILGEGSLLEKMSSWGFYMLYAMPLFWIATVMVVFFTTKEYGAWTDWFPSVGIRIRPGRDSGPWHLIFQNFDRLILPVLCMGVHALAFTTQQTKSEIKQQFQKPYVLAAKARGLSFVQILRNHVFPNSLVSYITIMTGRVASLLSGAIIIEYIFNIPGIGRLLFDSIYESDWPVIFGIIIIISVTTILALLLGDILLAMVNPRIKQKLASA